MLRKYELTLIFRISVADEKVKKTLEEIGKIISSSGKVTKTTEWGKRELSYPIKKEKEGKYLLLDMEADGDKILGLKEKFKLNEAILRYLFVRPPEQKKKAKEKKDK
ncbi:30S ribosomal protein S6 [Patescibacteria group bacterium]|nr:30S ribosomal protein S6 [Patescibacteria group bacterium]MCL5797547.1 30S ribosomal protein S6 [Patescibacteria group bacterium]